MASPAAILDVVVQANTTSATASLSRFDSRLKSTGSTATKAGRYTSDLNKRTGVLGGTMRRAAGYAAGAAAAYLSISQAKAAITTTQDLAKTTAGLNRNLGLTIKRGSQWGAVAKARDIDSKSLNMSFTTLSRRLTDLSKGSDTAKDSFADIGVTQKQLNKTGGDFNKQLLMIADAFGEAEGGAQRQQAAQKLLGRGYQTLLPLFAEGSESLKEQLGWADKYGATLSGDTLKAQMDLVNAQRESKVAMLGLQVSFTKMLTPALEEANKKFQRLSQIMGNDKLTRAEKFRKLGDVIGKWADKAFDAFVEILPKIVSEAGERAPRIAGALAKGFMNADIWGKLFAGAWFLSKLGGLRMFRSSGQTAGRTFGRGFGASVVIGALLFGPELLKMAFQWGKKIGRELKKAIKATGVIDWIQDIKTRDFGKAEALAAIKSGQFDGGIDAAREMLLNAGVNAEKANKVIAKAYNFAEGQGRKHNETMGAQQKKAADDVAKHTKKQTDVSNKNHKAMRDVGDKRTRELATRVVGTVNSMVGAVGNGYNRLKDNTNKALRGFGGKPTNFSISNAKLSRDPNGASLGRQRGGPINQGAPSGDSVPAMLERGEYVVNRKAVDAIGKQTLDKINFGAAPRFATGGLVQALGPYNIPPIQYDPNHAGGNSHLHLAMSSVAGAKALANRIKPMGWTASEAPWAGGVTVRHQDPGHYSGSSFDANAANESRSAVAAVARLLGSGNVGGAAQKIKRLLLKGPNGPLRTMGQGGLDKVRAAANALIKKRSAMSMDDGAIMSGSGDVEKTFAKVAKRLSNSRTATMALGMAGYAESGMRDLSYGDSSSQGALQLLSSTAAGLGVSPHDEAAIASLFLTRGFYGKGGANSLAAQGLPAHLVAQNVQGSAFSSGSNYAAQRGAALAWMRRFGLQKGGLVQMLAKGGPVDHARGLQRRLRRAMGRVGRIDERLDIAQRLGAAPYGPSGSDLSAGEKGEQVGLYGKLLDAMLNARKLARRGLGFARHHKKTHGASAAFRDTLRDLEGVTGKGGRIFDTKLALAELTRAPVNEGPAGISVSQLSEIVQAMRYGVFGPTGQNIPQFAKGGVVPGPVGAPVPAIVHGGERVLTPQQQANSIQVRVFLGDRELTDIVRTEITESDRASHARFRAGVTG